MDHTATLRFGYPDLSVPDHERRFLTLPAPKDIVNVEVDLQDARKAPELVSGAAGLDAQGFTYIRHHSKICECLNVLSGRNAKEIYLPEVEELICSLTGAKKAIVINSAIRQGLATKQENHSYVTRKGVSELDEHFKNLPRDVAFVGGKDQQIEPNRKVHIDYSLKGFRDTARYLRKDLAAAAKEALKAEDAGKPGPRYAAYSVWRPLKPVKRDPLIVCDWRTTNPDDFADARYRCPSELYDEFLVTAVMVTPPKTPSRPKWYWIPEQTPDDVLILKVGDTESEINPSVAGGCAHVSPIFHGTENEEARESIKCRVMAFW